MRGNLVLCFCTSLLLHGCAATPTLYGNGPLSPGDLIAAAERQQIKVLPAKIDPASILSMTDEMGAFVAKHVDLNAPTERRLKQLLTAMLEAGYVQANYTQNTLSASETFNQKTGNCLSFTNLFMALARTADLEVHYQTVEIPANWEAQGNWVILDKHINTVLYGLRLSGNRKRDYVVDFNIADFLGNYERQEVDDEHAYALYYNNLGVEAMRSDQPELAFAYFVTAYRLHDQLAGLWINLGVLFSQLGDYQAAESAQLIALRLDRANGAALSNLANLYRATKRADQASIIEQRILRYREQNPYYFYQLAQAQYAAKNWPGAMKLIKRALRLKNAEHQFHYLLAQIYQHTYQPQAALKSMRIAWELAPNARVKSQYEKGLIGLQLEVRGKN